MMITPSSNDGARNVRQRRAAVRRTQRIRAFAPHTYMRRSSVRARIEAQTILPGDKANRFRWNDRRQRSRTSSSLTTHCVSVHSRPCIEACRDCATRTRMIPGAAVLSPRFFHTRVRKESSCAMAKFTSRSGVAQVVLLFCTFISALALGMCHSRYGGRAK